MHSTEIWAFRVESGLASDPLERLDLTGYAVEALDGSIGKIDEATYDVGASQIVVDTGPWIFGKKVVLPAGIVDRVDSQEEKVYVHRTKDDIKDSPKFGESVSDDVGRDEVGGYYGPGGAGHRDW